MLYNSRSFGQVLVDPHGTPRYWPAVWQLFFGGALAESTLRRQLRHLDALYRSFDEGAGLGSLDDAIARCDLDCIAEGLDRFFVTLTNEQCPPATGAERWRASLHFVESLLERLARAQDVSTRLNSLRSRLERLERLYGDLRPARRRSSRFVRALPPAVLRELYEMVLPESASNPFLQVRTQWRAYVLFSLLLHQGLRRGESLILRVDGLKSERAPETGHRVFWLDVTTREEDADPRSSTPSQKNAFSVRQLPVSDGMALTVRTYVENWRGRCNHAWLLNSQRNLPLSAEGVNKMFIRISEQLSEDSRKELVARKGAPFVTPHDLRHTAAVVRLRQFWSRGMSDAQAMQSMRSFFGWSRDSTMPLLYAKAAFDERLATVWNDELDARVAVLRELPDD